MYSDEAEIYLPISKMKYFTYFFDMTKLTLTIIITEKCDS